MWGCSITERLGFRRPVTSTGKWKSLKKHKKKQGSQQRGEGFYETEVERMVRKIVNK